MTATILIVGDAPVPPRIVGRVGRFETWDAALSWFDSELAAALVGWRCTVVGPESEVHAARARAIAAGAVDDEITTVVTERSNRRTYCPVCGHVTSTSTDAVRCSGCWLELVVGEHFSPVLAAYLGSPC
ncbi:dimethylamine monooxygenase subunit DmmA family protein [Actinomycetes bacterium M1A6_2h]